MRQDPLHVALVEPEIPWNTGNAGRSCLAAGAQLHLVGPLGFSLDERAVRRAGLDYWPKVAPEVWSTFDAFEAALPSIGAPWFFSPDGERTLWDIDYVGPTVLVFGKESVGFDTDIRDRHRDRLVRMPFDDSVVRSLNMSTCVGIALYEVMRRDRA